MATFKGTDRASRIAALAMALTFLCAAAARAPRDRLATGTIALSHWPYLPGSAIRLAVDGFEGPYGVELLGPGTYRDGIVRVGDDARPGRVTLALGSPTGLAQRAFAVAAPPGGARALIAVAAYDDGVAISDASNFSPRGLLAIAGAPSDVAFSGDGRLVATDTQGDSLTQATLFPWRTSQVPGVPIGDELAIDEATHATFVTDRGAAGTGSLTRIAADGSTARVDTGATPEGLAIDERRGLVYVANVNDGTVAVVDAKTMRLVRRFDAVARVFSLALSNDGRTLYAVSNQSKGSPFAAPGSVVAIELDRGTPHAIARSADLVFPLGAALDAAARRLFVTDEEADDVYVLDPATLRAAHAPLATCRTPWKPYFDPVDRRLYVPCARDDRVDVFDARTLRRVRGAPFATAGYPLAVAVWHPGAHRAS